MLKHSIEMINGTKLNITITFAVNLSIKPPTAIAIKEMANE